MQRRLHNYLRTHRKRSGLSQGEIAMLLGFRYGSHIARQESGRRRLLLATALGYMVMFGATPDELFAGECDWSRQRVVQRAGVLLKMVEGEREGRRRALRLRTLRRIVGGES